MPYRARGRILGPLALLATIFAIYVIVHGQLGAPSAPGSSSPASAEPATSRHKAKRHYTVRPGDTLDAIAARTRVPIGRLVDLNPDLDANSLRAGQTLRLRSAP